MRRGFLVIGLLCLLPSASFADEADDLVEKLAKKHGLIAEREGLDKTKPICKLTMSSPATKQNAEEIRTLLKELPNLKGLKTLGFTNARIGNTVLKAVGQCKKLEYLDLGGNNLLNADGLKELSGLENLKTLGLDGVPISDDALKAIGQIKCLEYLKISRTRITGSGFEDLAGLTKLKSLDALESPLTDECLKHLPKLKSLETFIPGGKLSKEAVKELYKQMPRLNVPGYPSK